MSDTSRFVAEEVYVGATVEEAKAQLPPNNLPPINYYEAPEDEAAPEA
jgi:hypothetical protein